MHALKVSRNKPGQKQIKNILDQAVQHINHTSHM